MCEQQVDSFFFESSVLGCDTFDKSGGEDPTHASPGCHHRGFVAALNRRRRRPSFSAGRFCRNPTSTWEMTSVGSFTPKQIRRRCVILMFLTLPPNPSHGFCTSVFFATQLCGPQKENITVRIAFPCGVPTEFLLFPPLFSIILLPIVLLMGFVVRQIQSHNVATL